LVEAAEKWRGRHCWELLQAKTSCWIAK